MKNIGQPSELKMKKSLLKVMLLGVLMVDGTAQSAAGSNQITLSPGWNMVGFSQLSDKTDLSWIAQQLPNGGALWRYSACGSWGYAHINRDPSLEAYNTIQTVGGERGYWLYVDGEDGQELTVPSAATTTTSISSAELQLFHGWNMVTVAQALSPQQFMTDHAGVDRVYGWDSTHQSWQSAINRVPDYLNSLKSMEPGRGYYVYFENGTLSSGAAPSLKGLIPGSVVEIYGDNGSYYRAEAMDSELCEQAPFQLELEADMGYRMVVKSAEGGINELVTHVGFQNSLGLSETRFSLSQGDHLDLGYLNLPKSRQEAVDVDQDGVHDNPYWMSGAGVTLLTVGSDVIDLDGDGILNPYDRDYVDNGSDSDRDGIPDRVDANPSNEHHHENRLAAELDRDRDGYLDGDRDRDGLYDDDHDRDGFHDDDHDRDGYHDDDLDRDGYHDDDHDRDGFHDDDHDRDGYHDDDLDHDGEHDGPTSAGGTAGTATPTSPRYRLLAFNDLGMHCVDRESSVYSILPPYNVVQAQLIEMGRVGSKPRLVSDLDVDLQYSAVADQSGSINTHSQGKSDFWGYVAEIFGVSLAEEQGLSNQKMPGINNVPQKFTRFDAITGRFTAPGIPITPIDDAGHYNPYPMMKIEAINRAGGSIVGSTPVVLPVSSETDCQNCHATGTIAAQSANVTWATDSDREIQTKKNVLILHDTKHGTDLQRATPVLCASCHYSAALDLAGSGPNATQQQHQEFSVVMHRFHGEQEEANGIAMFPENGTTEQTCYQCHPGQQTRCLRGAMGDAGVECKDCHGGMLAVGGAYPLLSGGSIDGLHDGQSRRPWKDLPRCQSCHTGDALSNGGSIRHLKAFESGDSSASPRLATNKRFAENDNHLYRESSGHGGVACASCHGSTHAIYPIADSNSNDNVAAQQAQSYAGAIRECSVCHEQGSLGASLNGPHGLHPINDPVWIDEDGHGEMFERNPSACKSCHGTDLRGTVLSSAATARTYRTGKYGAVSVVKGEKVGCYQCHNGPNVH